MSQMYYYLGAIEMWHLKIQWAKLGKVLCENARRGKFVPVVITVSPKCRAYCVYLTSSRKLYSTSI